jgi:hypothetical protein
MIWHVHDSQSHERPERIRVPGRDSKRFGVLVAQMGPPFRHERNARTREAAKERYVTFFAVRTPLEFLRSRRRS